MKYLNLKLIKVNYRFPPLSTFSGKSTSICRRQGFDVSLNKQHVQGSPQNVARAAPELDLLSSLLIVRSLSLSHVTP